MFQNKCELHVRLIDNSTEVIRIHGYQAKLWNQTVIEGGIHAWSII